MSWLIQNVDLQEFVSSTKHKMEREILFRGKIVDERKWIYGNLHTEYAMFEDRNGWFIGDFDDWEEVHPYSIGQFTGLKDKNGVKIFDGDAIEEGIVHWNDEYLGFFVKNDLTAGMYTPLYDIPLPEIAGNIHDNPELLKK